MPTELIWSNQARADLLDIYVLIGLDDPAAAERYFDPKLAEAWLTQLRALVSSQVRITVTPEWVGLLDFETRFPSALSS